MRHCHDSHATKCAATTRGQQHSRSHSQQPPPLPAPSTESPPPCPCQPPPRPPAPPRHPTCFLGYRLCGTGPSSKAKAGLGGTTSTSCCSASLCLLPRKKESCTEAPAGWDLMPICRRWQGGPGGPGDKRQGQGRALGRQASGNEGLRVRRHATGRGWGRRRLKRRRCHSTGSLRMAHSSAARTPPKQGMHSTMHSMHCATRRSPSCAPAGRGLRTGCRCCWCTACAARPARPPPAGWGTAPRPLP